MRAGVQADIVGFEAATVANVDPVAIDETFHPLTSLYSEVLRRLKGALKSFPNPVFGSLSYYACCVGEVINREKRVASGNKSREQHM